MRRGIVKNLDYEKIKEMVEKIKATQKVLNALEEKKYFLIWGYSVKENDGVYNDTVKTLKADLKKLEDNFDKA